MGMVVEVERAGVAHPLLVRAVMVVAEDRLDRHLPSPLRELQTRVEAEAVVLGALMVRMVDRESAS